MNWGHLIVSAIVTLGAGAGTKVSAQPGITNSRPAPVNLSDYNLLFSDDFDGNYLNEKYWNHRHENETINNAVNLRGNVTLENGLLRLKDAHESSGRYTSSQISTEQHPELWTKYGYFELRAKLSAGVGTSSAFWLQSPRINTVSIPFDPAANGVEIDIFENGIAFGAGKLFYSLHWNGYDPEYAQHITQTDLRPEAYRGFHVYALEWTPQGYRVFIDGELRSSTDTMISRTHQFVILGNGRGGFGGFAEPFPNPDYFEVDYIKVYRRKPEVLLFSGAGFTGKVSIGLVAGKYSRSQLSASRISPRFPGSVEIPKGWRVTLYDNDGCRGSSQLLTGDQPNFISQIDQLGSLQIEEN